MLRSKISVAKSALGSGNRRSMASASSSASGGFAFAVKVAAGIKVASRDDGRPTSSLSVIIRAGSRFENQPGIAHVLEKFAFKATENRTALRIVRETELIGGQLSSKVTREHIVLNAQFLREDLSYFTELLGEVVSKTRYAPYILPEDVLPLVGQETELAMRDPPALAADALHSLAYRRGLGNALLCHPECQPTIESVREFARQAYVKGNMAVVATGVEENEFQELVSKHFADVPSGKLVQSTASKYFGGEARIPMRSRTGHFVMGFPGEGAAHSSASYTVLSQVLGGMSSIKWSHGNSILSQVASHQGSQTKAIANHGTYTDAGLFSVYVMGPTRNVGPAASEALRAVKSLSKDVKADEVTRAIAQARFNLYASAEERTMSAEAIGRSLLVDGSVPNVAELVSAVEKIKPDHIKKTASHLLEAKPSVVAIGETRTLPYFDEL